MIKILETNRNNYDKSMYIYNDDGHIILIDCIEDIFSEIASMMIPDIKYITIIITHCGSKNLVACNNIIELVKVMNKSIFIYAPVTFKPFLYNKITSSYMVRYTPFDSDITVHFRDFRYNLLFKDCGYDNSKSLLEIQKTSKSTYANTNLIYTGAVELITNQNIIK